MAQLTPLSLESAQHLGARYGLSVLDVRPILAGSVNSNFELVQTQGPRVFLRVYEEQAAPSAAREAALLDHLSAGGVTTPRPLRLASGSGFIAEHAGKPVAVFPWVEGDVSCQARVTPARAAEVGAALARVHVAGSDFAAAPDTRFGAGALARRLEGLPAEAREGSLGEAVRRLEHALAALPAAAPARAAVIHGDLFRDNVLWSPDDPDRIAALLDFESASRGLYSFDLAVTLLAWCYGDGLDEALARALVAGYTELRPLDPEDRAELFDQARFAALRFAITRITDYELRPRGSGIYKDYRRFLARLAAVDALGPTGFAGLTR